MKSIFHALNRLKVFRGLTEQEFAWVLYDVGNSAFTMLSCSLIPIWFKSLAIGTAPGQINSHQATAYYSIAVAVVTVIVALLGPIFGVLADHKDKKKVLFATAATLGIFGCILNGFITGWLLFLIIFVFTKICYSASLTIYDSMLNDITSEERMDEVSSYGFAWGYIGSCIPFLIALIAYVLGPDMVGVLPDMLSKGIGFTVTAVWWLLVTIPLIRGFKQRNYVETEGHDIRKAFAEIFHTLKNIATHDKKVLFFLIAFFLYIDGVGTIIDNAINIGTDLNLNTVGQVVFLLATQVVAFGGSLVFAKLSKKYNTVTLILDLVLRAISASRWYALMLSSLCTSRFWRSSSAASRAPSSRSRARITPRSSQAENSGDTSGIYDIFSKGASFLGSAVIAAVKLAGGTINVAVACLAVFFALGFLFLRIADKQKAIR